MGRYRLGAWGRNETKGKSHGHSARVLLTRRLRLELLEDRRLLTASPAMPDLLDISDSGVSPTDNLTNLDNSTPDKTLKFAVGGTIADATVTLFADGVAIGSTVAYGATTIVVTNGNYDLADGAHAITARQTLRVGGESPGSAALTVTIATSLPASPLAPDLRPASDTGISSTDNITGNNTPTFDLAVAPGLYFRLYRDGVQISGDYETSASYTTPVQVDGTHAYSVAAVDAAGSISTPSAALWVTVDSSIPSTPDLLAVSDTGVSNTDNLTNLDNSRPSKSLQFAVGNTVQGATVTVCVNGFPIASAVAGSGTTIVTTSGNIDLVDTTYRITARQTLPGRPESTDSAALVVTIDTVAPIFANPVRLGGYYTSSPIADVAISGTRAYVAEGDAGMEILDVSDLTAPVRLGTFKTAGVAVSVAVSGTRAYVADYYAGLLILDVSDPAAPVQLGAFDTSGYPTDVVLSGTLAYTVSDYDVLEIIDVTNPAVPVRVGGYFTNGFPQDVAIAGTLVCLADGTRGLAIFDVGNPANPVRLGGYDTSGSARGVAVSGTLAYVADGPAGLVILDIANPAAPVRLGGVDTSGSASNVAVLGTRAYLADGSAGLLILDVSNPAVPVQLGTFDTAGNANGVFLSGTLAYVVDSSAGLQVVDLDPSPDLQPSSDTGISNTDNITADTTPTFNVSVPAACYFRVYRDGVQISGDCETGNSYTTAVQNDGTYAYSFAVVDAAGNAAFPSPALAVTVDASIPSAPDLLARSDTGISTVDNLTNLDNGQPGQTLQFTVGNTVAGATVTLYADGVAIGVAVAKGATTTVTSNGSLDLTDGTYAITARQTRPGRPESTDSATLAVTIDTAATLMNPVRLGGYNTSGYAQGVTISETLAYVADGSAGLQIIDVSNPAAPTRLGGYDTSGGAWGTAVSGTVAYLADGGADLQIIDVSNPAAPAWLRRYNTSGAARGVTISGTLVYVADDIAGLEIIDVSNPTAPVWLGGYDTPGSACGVAVSGTLAYVADYDAGLQIIDVSNPAAPVRVGVRDTSGYALHVVVSGRLAYVADGTAGLQIIDVSNPAAPLRLGGYDTSGFVWGVAVSGTRVYLADNSAGLEIIDVSNPAWPVRLGGYDTSGYAYGVAVSGTLAYVADSDAGLQIIDVSLPTAPSALDLQPASDTGISSTDNVTADTTPTFDLSVPAGAYFRIYRDGVQISGDYQSGNSYTTAVQADGTYTYTVAAVDAAGNVSDQSPSLAVTIDTQPPAVTNLLVGGTGWTGDFLDDLTAASSDHVGGYSIPVGSGSQLATLPWSNINQIKVVFSEHVIADKADLTLSGAHVAQYDLASATFNYDPATFTATWTLSSPLAADVLQVRLNADGASPVQDPIARRLDGEWTNPATPADASSDTYPSGNGVAGGDFVFQFRMLPGDANHDGAVDIFDLAKLQVNYGDDHGMMPEQGDFNGDGRVDIFDVALLQVEFGRTLELPAPAPAVAPGAEESERGPSTFSPRAADSERDLDARQSSVPVLEKGTFPFSGAPSQSFVIAKPWKSRRSPFPKPAPPLAVHHAVENASWESAVDRLLECGEVELTR